MGQVQHNIYYGGLEVKRPRTAKAKIDTTKVQLANPSNDFDPSGD